MVICGRGKFPPAGRKQMALGFSPPTKEVIIMTDYEMLSTFIMIIMLVFAVLSFCKKDQ